MSASSVTTKRTRAGTTQGRWGRRNESRVGRAAQQSVQLVQLTSLALPADPTSFPFVPTRRRWSSRNGRTGVRAVALVEPSTRRYPPLQAARRAASPSTCSVMASTQRRPLRNPQAFLRAGEIRGSPAARSAPRSPHVLSEASAPQRVRRCEGTPSRRAKVGRSVAQCLGVTPRFTSATAASMAGIVPSAPNKISHGPEVPHCGERKKAVRRERSGQR